ncbi:MAG: ammonium transporter [Peptococcaceae bacterium]
MFSSVDTIWVLFGAVLVFSMQAGFTLVEAGMTRLKNSGNIIMKNMMDLCLGSIVYWIIGFGIMFGTDLVGIIGIPDFFVRGDYDSSFSTYAFLIFQTVFCATAATIVSGAMAERTKFSAYLLYSVIISAVIYPISGHWIWGGGWLSQLGFHDFAGSTAVHMVGGVAALVGAKILGPRIGKYDADGKSKAIPGQSIPFAALGVFILWFGWFGFNGASTVCATGDDALYAMGLIFVNTNLAAATAAAATMFTTWKAYGKPDVSMTLNGALAGLVGITAGCDAVNPVGAFFIGLICGILVVAAVEVIDKVLKVDDPVGAVSVHGVCGAAGTILTGIFATDGGLFYGGGFAYTMTQILGVVAVAAYVAVVMGIVFLIIRATVGLRVTAEEEIMGLDVTEHGLPPYTNDFKAMFETAYHTSLCDAEVPVSMEEAVPVKVVPSGSTTARPAGDVKISKVEIMTNETKFSDLKAAMAKIGVSGMTVSHVLGCGLQKGQKQYYRGVQMEMNLLPKIKIEIVVCKVPVDLVVDTARKALYTGKVGDGKIFVYDCENVIRIRTADEGYDALQDEAE